MSSSPFSEACRLLRHAAPAGHGDAVPQAAASPQETEAAATLLQELGYLAPNSADGRLVTTALTAGEQENRLALLRLAGRLERVFQLPSPQVPQGFFLGSELAPGRFGLEAPDGNLVSASGRGLTLAAAFESCIGEAAEYLSFLSWGQEESFRAPVPSPGTAKPADDGSGGGTTLDWLLGGVGSDRAALQDRPIDWVTLRSIGGAATLAVPLDLCLRRPLTEGCAISRKAESAGCGAGASTEAAQYTALMELVERDAIALWWHGGLPAGPLPLDAAAWQALSAHVADLRRHATRPCWLLDITSETGIPTVAAHSSQVDGTKVVSGFAADIDYMTAAKKALLELCQMEIAEDIVSRKIQERGTAGLHETDRRLLHRLSRLNVAEYPQLSPRRPPRAPGPDVGSPGRDKLDVALAVLGGAGFNAYWLDLNRPEIGIPAARVVIPGLQSVDVSWRTDRLLVVLTEYKQNVPGQGELPPII